MNNDCRHGERDILVYDFKIRILKDSKTTTCIIFNDMVMVIK